MCRKAKIDGVCIQSERKLQEKGEGVGFLVSEDVWNTVGKVLEVSSRILSLFVKVGRMNI
jgi:hypothetical protein